MGEDEIQALLHTEGLHIFTSASVGMKAICPNTVNTALSTRKKNSLGIPNSTFLCVTSSSCVSERGTDTKVVQNINFLISTSFSFHR